MKKITKAFTAKIERELGHSDFIYQAKSWDRKLLRLNDEMLVYIIQKASYILNQRGEL